MVTNRREHLAAGGLLALAALVLFSQLTQHPSDLLVGVQRDGRNDVTSHTLAARSVIKNEFAKSGDIALWHGRGLLGSPWLGNPQSALFYPPHWLFFFADVAAWISWMTVAHHWFAGLGVYFLSRREGVCWSGATVAAICFAAAPFLIAQTGEGHSTQVFLIAWAPWAFLVYDYLRSGTRGAWAVMSLVLSTAFFCGHVQEAYYLVLILCCLVVGDFVAKPAGATARFGLAKNWLMAGIATIGLVAIELGPNWVYTRFGVRASGMNAEAAGRISAGFESLAQLLNPFALGGATGYRGPGEYYWETLCCCGVAPLLLAALGAAMARNRSRSIRWLLIAAVSLLFAMGGDTPLFPAMHRYVPGISLFRSPGRALFFTSLAVAMLAGAGWDSVLHRMKNSSTQERIGWRLAPLLVGTAALAFVFMAGRRVGGIELSAAAVCVAAICASIGLVTWKPVAKWAAIGAFLVCTGELTYYANAMLATVPANNIRTNSPVAAALLHEPHVGRVLVRQELLSDREAWNAGIEKLRRYEPVPLAATFATMAALTPIASVAQEITGFEPLNLAVYRKPMLDMLGVTHVILSHKEPRELAGWELVARGDVEEEVVLRGREARVFPYAIYRNPDAISRAYVHGDAQLLGSDRADAALARLDPRRKVLLRDDTLPAGSRQPFRAAEVIARSPNRVVIKAELEAPGYLVLSDAYYPGWRATVDGDLTTVSPANIGLRCVALDAGQHDVAFDFSPPGMAIGGIISTLSATVIAFSCAGSLRRWRTTATLSQMDRSEGERS